MELPYEIKLCGSQDIAGGSWCPFKIIEKLSEIPSSIPISSFD